MLDTNKYLSWRFNIATRNCWHLVRAAWMDLTGKDIGDRTPETITAASLIGTFDADVPTFRHLDKPTEPCIVLMRRRGEVPHVGLHHRGKVLQITRHGASYTPLDAATAGFTSVEFYA